ncbi:MAG TPA: 5-(carboxyamino)imidazole ribonucleotide mutase [Planctomycetota bacterium]|nr:5-(carboxyamino)imidazole ribonucleotide mutase [Planctomycetota bacterium]
MSDKQVAVVMGSDSDLPVVSVTVELLKEFGLGCEVRVMSAHRTPDEVHAWATGAESRGVKVIIAAAGGAAHLAGVIASQTTLPVIGIPMESAALSGLDSLLSTVQMPAGVPVATVAIGKAGATNAAVLALQILALADDALRKKLTDYKTSLAEKVNAKDAKVRKQYE